MEAAVTTEGGETTTQELSLEFMDLDLPAKSYAVFRQELSFRDVNGFLAIEGDSMMRKMTRANIEPLGSMTTLTYVWDTQRGFADVATAIEVEPGTSFPPYAVINFPATKALSVDLEGPYDRLSIYHLALGEELKRRGLIAGPPSFEEYLVGPTETRDADKFRTRITYPYTSPE